MTADLQIAARLGVAALAGLAIGVERERSGHAAGPRARFAGARTMFLMGLLSGFAGWLASGGYGALGVTLVAGGAGLAIAAYVMAAHRSPEAIDGTTETAALAVLGLGFAAGLGHLAIVGGATAVVALALAEKSVIHGAIQRIADEELRAAFQFGVLALVVLPILPEGPYGPFGGVRPRELWIWVLLISGVSFAGYLVRRAVGQTRGYRMTGFLGGIISSTLVMLSFSRQSRTEPGLSRALGVGAVASSTVPFFRVAAISLVINPAVTIALVPYLVVPFLVSAGILVLALRRRPAEEGGDAPASSMRSPLGLPSAIKMAIAFQIVLIAIHFVQERFGNAGILTTAGFVGLADVDALTLSMSKLGGQAAFVEIAARAVAVGLFANTLLRFGMALAIGSAAFRRTAGAGLFLLAAAGAAGLLLPLRFAAAAFAP
jgi:uncharacterized membrane protein (DUF4010 family)